MKQSWLLLCKAEPSHSRRRPAPPGRARSGTEVSRLRPLEPLPAWESRSFSRAEVGKGRREAGSAEKGRGSARLGRRSPGWGGAERGGGAERSAGPGSSRAAFSEPRSATVTAVSTSRNPRTQCLRYQVFLDKNVSRVLTLAPSSM